ncbi:ionotropic receptor 93a-like isoform X2 [Macrobrachium nipponense]|uniref:ionotropic receptor 93a-like isoform X2 n=2 Tax=Macrobrachium nipponense TaxID=159736 RepID=UPI0030C7A215
MYISLNKSPDLSLGLKASSILQISKGKNNNIAFETKISSNIGLRRQKMSLLKTILLAAHLLSIMATSLGLYSSAIRMKPDLTEMAAEPIRDILAEITENRFSTIFISDGYSVHSSVLEKIGSSAAPQGIGVIEVSSSDNISNMEADSPEVLLSTARELRKLSWKTLVVVTSSNSSFLTSFSNWSLSKRLVGPETKLLAVTRTNQANINQILRSSWTFSMMNAMVLNLEGAGNGTRCSLYSHMPYSPRGKDQIYKLATWRKNRGFSLTSELQIFPPKFNNFFGFAVPVTALPFPPFWDEKKPPGNSSAVTYSGTDFYLLDAIAQAHNFTIYVVPTKDWGEVLDKVEIRESYIASVFHAVLPMRLKRFDYSSVYEYSSVDFSFAKPEVKPQWQSLYYPLSQGVWISTGVLLVIMAGLVITFVRVSDSFMEKNRLDTGTALLETLGTLLGQNLSHGFPKSQSWRVLLGFWMIFAFIFGSAFRGNLIAYLTLPKYPPRPENLKELLRVAERITMPPYGKDFKAFFSQSDSEDFIKLAKLMQIVPSVHEGQEQALQGRQGHLDTRRYQEHYIAQFHTRIDGSTKLYVARDGVLPGKSAWPLPHDAPYAPVINRGLIAVLEASLYEHWSKQLIEETKSETRRRLREKQAMMVQEGITDHSTDSSGQATMALTLVHIQGPLMLLLIGHILALSAFASEYVLSFYVKV